jgi:hypothetical protein
MRTLLADPASARRRCHRGWVEPPPWPYRQVIHRAFLIAAESGERCRPVHFVAALGELDGPIATALRPPGGGPLFLHPPDPLPVHGGGAGYLAMQTQQAAGQLASERGEVIGSQHLLMAVIDQAEPEAVALLRRAGIDLGLLRAAALRILGAPPGLPPIAIPPLTPAGIADRPPLAVDQLDVRAWSVLCWRQEHLPLARLRRQGDWHALSHLEHRAAWRIADRFGVDDDQRHSLGFHHNHEVERLAYAASPAVVETTSQLMERFGHEGPLLRRGRRRRRRRLVPNFMMGWPTWFANRRVGLRDKRFWLMTRSAYRDQPARDS